MTIISWFKELSQNDASTAGAKAAKMGELVNARLPIPEGFVITTEAYQEFLDLGGIRQKISEQLADLDYNNEELLNSASEEVSNLILSTQLPTELSREIKNAYQELCMKKDIIIAGKTDIPVRITTSNFDSPPLDGIRGASEVAKTIQKLWASLYLPETLRRFKAGGAHPTVAVMVQKLVMSEKAGVMQGENGKIIIQAGWGLADAVKSHGILPDKYAVSGSEIIEKEINDQDWMYRAMPDGTRKKTEVLGSQRNIQKLTDQEIVRLAQLYQEYSSHTNSPLEIEWSIIGRDVFILHEEPVEQPAEQSGQVPEPPGGGERLGERLSEAQSTTNKLVEAQPTDDKSSETPPPTAYQPPPKSEPEPEKEQEPTYEQPPEPTYGTQEQSAEPSALQPISEHEQSNEPTPQYLQPPSPEITYDAEADSTPPEQSPEYESSSAESELLIRDPAAALTLDNKLEGKEHVLVDADSLAARIVPDNPNITNDAVMELLRQIVGKCREKGVKVGIMGGLSEEDIHQLSSIGFDKIFSDSA